LQEAIIRFPYTHDLEVLLALVVGVEPLWSGYTKAAKSLSKHAVKTRYPGANRTRAEAKEAVEFCAEFRSIVRQSLGLKV
jgi:HEPN domain-containing protein